MAGRLADIDMPAKAGSIEIGTCGTVGLKRVVERLFQNSFDLCARHVHLEQCVGEGKQLLGIAHCQVALGNVGAHAAAILHGDVARLSHFTEDMGNKHRDVRAFSGGVFRRTDFRTLIAWDPGKIQILRDIADLDQPPLLDLHIEGVEKYRGIGILFDNREFWISLYLVIDSVSRRTLDLDHSPLAFLRVKLSASITYGMPL